LTNSGGTFRILAKERALAALSALLLPIIAFIKVG
jgi:hypothetical protein